MQSAFLRTTDRKAVLDHIFFNGWAGPARTAIVGVMAYAMLIVFLRLSGKRTLSKMNAFDFIVTVALGSVLATILLSKDVTVLQGGVALALLIVLQYAVTWTSVRIGWVRKLVTGEPTLLLFEGQLLAEAMRRTRVRDLAVFPRNGYAFFGRGACDATHYAVNWPTSKSLLQILRERQRLDRSCGIKLERPELNLECIAGHRFECARQPAFADVTPRADNI